VPPKVRITEDAILETSIQLLREKGLDAINARELAERLNCSTQPIFYRFENMDELKKVLYKKIENVYNQYMLDGMETSNSFLGMGIAYINFAKNEKNLFKLLFMSDSIKVKSIFEMIEGEDNQEIIQIISQMTNLQEEKAKQLYINIWLVTHGIASMLATNSCTFTDSEIETILEDSFTGFSNQLRSK
jgi:AcrR family transcriptional regulator